MRIIIFVMVLSVGCCSFAADPTTRPNWVDVTQIKNRINAAKKAAEKARTEAEQKWETSAEFKKLKADADAKTAALEAARAGSDSQAKLDASVTYNRARLELARATAEAMKGVGDEENETIRSAEEELRIAEKQNDIVRQYDKKERDKRDAEKALGDAPVVTFKDLNLTGEKYRGQLVRIDGRLLTTYDPAKMREFEIPGSDFPKDPSMLKCVGFSLVDTNADVITYIIGDKETLTPVLLKIKPRQPITIFGKVVLNDPRFRTVFFLCSRIEPTQRH